MSVAAPPLIMLHGCGGTPDATFGTTGWLERFQRSGRPVQAPYLPAHGPDGGPHDPLAYADLTNGMLARLPREPVDLIGFSLGAKIALSIAVHAPERIRRLVVAGIGDNLFAPESVGEAAAKALEHGIGDDTPASVRAFLSTWQPRVNNALAVAALLRRPSNPQIDEHQLSASNISTLLINGSDDAICMQTDILLPALRPIRHLVIARAGHFDLMARAETLDAAELFLESPQSPHSQETD